LFLLKTESSVLHRVDDILDKHQYREQELYEYLQSLYSNDDKNRTRSNFKDRSLIKAFFDRGGEKMTRSTQLSECRNELGVVEIQDEIINEIINETRNEKGYNGLDFQDRIPLKLKFDRKHTKQLPISNTTKEREVFETDVFEIKKEIRDLLKEYSPSMSQHTDRRL
jgi:hypothetical protein